MQRDERTGETFLRLPASPPEVIEQVLVLHRTSSFGYRKSNFLRASATRNVQTILA